MKNHTRQTACKMIGGSFVLLAVGADDAKGCSLACGDFVLYIITNLFDREMTSDLAYWVESLLTLDNSLFAPC